MIYRLLLIVLLSVYSSAWEVNTHRLIDRKALNMSGNVKKFIEDTQIDTGAFEDRHLEYLGYGTTYSLVPKLQLGNAA